MCSHLLGRCTAPASPSCTILYLLLVWWLRSIISAKLEKHKHPTNTHLSEAYQCSILHGMFTKILSLVLTSCLIKKKKKILVNLILHLDTFYFNNRVFDGFVPSPADSVLIRGANPNPFKRVLNGKCHKHPLGCAIRGHNVLFWCRTGISASPEPTLFHYSENVIMFLFLVHYIIWNILTSVQLTHTRV